MFTLKGCWQSKVVLAHTGCDPSRPGSSLTLKLPNVTEINRVILICSSGRQCQILSFLGSLQLWLKARKERSYPTGSELAPCCGTSEQRDQLEPRQDEKK